MQSNEQLAASILLKVWVDGKLMLTDDTERIKRKLTEFLDEDAETALRFRRKFELPVINFQMPVVVFGNGDTESDYMNQYAVAKGTCER
jgi:hypothetical protein